MDVFLASAFPMFAKKALQPSSDKSFNCLLFARLLSTRGHPLSSCKKGTRISTMTALQRVDGEQCCGSYSSQIINYNCHYLATLRTNYHYHYSNIKSN